MLARLGLLGLVALSLAACNVPGMIYDAGNAPTVKIVPVGQAEWGGQEWILYCDKSHGNLIYTADNGRMAVVPGGCINEP